MGLFSFVQSAGEKLFGSNEVENSQKEAKIKEFVDQMGLKVENFNPSVDGSTVCLEGTCTETETKEKVILAVGNVEGVEKIEDKMEVSSPEPEAQFYTVKSGDSLSKISKEFYGDPMKYSAIFEANKPMLADPDKIYPGQVLRVPAMNA